MCGVGAGKDRWGFERGVRRCEFVVKLQYMGNGWRLMDIRMAKDGTGLEDSA